MTLKVLLDVKVEKSFKNAEKGSVPQLKYLYQERCFWIIETYTTDSWLKLALSQTLGVVHQ